MKQGIPTIYKLLAAAVLIPLAGLLALTIALKIWLPPAKVRQLIVEQAAQYLHREVKLESVSLGVVKGLVVEGLEVSEKPDFKAGKFAGVDSFRLRIRLLPLLRKKVVIDEITLSGLSVSVVQLKPGVFNFSDLTEAPAKASPAKPAAQSAGLALPFALEAGVIALKDGGLTYNDKVSGARWKVSKLRAALKQLSLSKPFGVEAGLLAEQVSPGSLKAKLDFSGEADLSGLAKGKLSADIKKLAADVSGLTMTLSGPVRVDPDRIEVPELKGRLGEGALSIKATVLDYKKAPDARLEASLGQLDAAKLLEVKAAATGPQAPAGGRSPKAAPAPAAKAAPSGPPMKTSGKLAVGKILYNKFVAEKFDVSWDLKGITPDLRGLSGWAKMGVGGGTFESEDKSGQQSPLMRALFVPLTVLKQIGRLGSSLRLLPSFDKIVFSEIKGDYVFERGLMTIRDFHMNSAAANVVTTGTVDLPGQKLALQAEIAVANLAPIGVDIGGTFEEPKPRLRLTKAMAEPVKKLVAPAMDMLKGLFKRK